jgi:hypothetical protein
MGMSAYNTETFGRPGGGVRRPSPSEGLEGASKMNFVHIGNSIEYGLHIAFGSVAPKVSDLHLYVYPMQYLWRPSWGQTTIFNLSTFQWDALVK